MTPQPHQRTERAVSQLVLQEPFFATLLLYLKRSYTNEVPTMATDGEQILINPEFAESLTDPQIKGVLIHEVLHCALGHIWRRGGRDPRKANEAADHAVNLIITDHASTRHAIELPSGCLLDQKYRDMPWERIYNMLPDSPPPQGRGRGKGKGKGDGNPMPGDCLFQPCDTATDKQAAEQKAAEWQGRLVQADQAARMQGKQSASLSRLVGELIAPKLPWRQLLRRFLTEKAKNDYDWMKPDRRFHDVYLPTLGDEEAAGEIVVAVDTSGSINGTVISAFFSEIDAIHKDLRPTKLTVVYCDAKVHEPADEFGPEDQIVANPKGGGGTSFEPVFNWLEEHHRTPQVLVYLTDLYGDFPAAPPRYPVLWACWSKVDSVPFGEVINVDE